MTLLVLGANGFIGQAFVRQKTDGEIYVARRPPNDDYVGFDPSTDCLQRIPGITDVTHALLLFAEREPDRCAVEPAKTRKLNVDVPCKVIDQCLELGIIPMFASSELVFGGEQGMYEEHSIPTPILEYGRQKLATERHLLSRSKSGIVLRFPKTVGIRKGNRSLFVDWLVKISQRPGLLRCAADQYFSTQFVDDIPAIVRILIHKHASGLFHFCDGQRHSRFGLLSQLCARLYEMGYDVPKLEKISIRDVTVPEPRPFDVSMNSSKLRSIIGVEPKRVEDLILRLALEYRGSS